MPREYPRFDRQTHKCKSSYSMSELDRSERTNGASTQPDFKFVGEKLGIKPHTAYCRFHDLKKKLFAEGGSNDVDTKGKAEAGSAGKRKRANIGDESDDVAIKAKHGRPSKSPGNTMKRDVKAMAVKGKANDGDEKAAAGKIGDGQKGLALDGELGALDEAFLDGQSEVHDDDEV